MKFRVWLMFILVVYAHPSEAVDGVIEINQARALSGAVTPSDTPGFPVTLDTQGNYRLTSNLVLPDVNTNGVEISSDDVSLDLNGFEIKGPNICSTLVNFPVSSCNLAGSGRGVLSFSENSSILNGVIRGVGSNGIEINGQGARIEGMRVYHCGFNGISLKSRGMVLNSQIFHNLLIGISGGGESKLIGNLVWGNGSMGIDTQGGLVADTLSGRNGGAGMDLNGGGYTQSEIQNNSGGTVLNGINMGQNVCNFNTTCP